MPDSFMVLYKALVRSHLEHAVSVWNPHHQLLIAKLEKGHKISYCCHSEHLNMRIDLSTWICLH